MARLARIVVPGFPHHVTQRGNRRATVFHNDDARREYLALFQHYARKHGVAVWAYCLMPNHVHFVVVPRTEQSLARAFQGAHTAFAQRVNKRRGESGHLWQGRFFSCPLDEAHTWAAVRYVERNPVRAKLARRAEDFAWSSAAAHCGRRADELLSPEFPPRGLIADWSAWLRAPEEARQEESLRRQTHVGRPCGSPDFLARLEGLLERVLRPGKRGRKKKRPVDARGKLFNE
jgi:putative transposase